VLFYTLSMAHALRIDLAAAARRKMEKNRRKHPPGSAAY
jgi:NTP pyrophosphatase (non-canonical NTP hydrolase)